MANTITAGNATNNGLIVSPDNTGALEIKTGSGAGTTAVTVDTSQRTGFGTSSPTQKVTISDATASNQLALTGAQQNSIQFQNATGGNGFIVGRSLFVDNANDFFIYDAATSTTRLLINSSGNVGIGTDTPGASYRLAVSANNAGMSLQDTGSVGTWLDFKTGSGTVQGNIYYNFTNGYMAFGTAAAGSGQVERLRITSTGTLTSQATYDNTASGSTVVVTSAGLVRRTSSSIKYKKDVETLDAVLASNAVDNLRPVWYRTKNAEGDDKATWSHIGLIAEEVHEVEPRLVRYKTVEVSYDEEGQRVETELATPEPEDVDYARLSVLLLAEVRSLKERIAALEAK
jgi:hypothetical protein